MTGNGRRGEERLTAKQSQAVAALIAHPNARAAAHAVGVSERTLNRWRNSEPFRRAHRDASQVVWEDALTELRGAQLAAVRTLRDSLAAPSAPDRLRAARALVDIGLRVADLDLERRVHELEAAMQEVEASW